MWLTDETGRFVPYWSDSQIRQLVEAMRTEYTIERDGHEGFVIHWACDTLLARLGLEEDDG
jgi:hypothetical protein